MLRGMLFEHRRATGGCYGWLLGYFAVAVPGQPGKQPELRDCGVCLTAVTLAGENKRLEI